MTIGDFLHPVKHGNNGRFVGGQQRFSELQIRHGVALIPVKQHNQAAVFFPAVFQNKRGNSVVFPAIDAQISHKTAPFFKNVKNSIAKKKLSVYKSFQFTGD